MFLCKIEKKLKNKCFNFKKLLLIGIHLFFSAAGTNCLAKYLSSVDTTYGASFVSESWREAVERWEKPDVQEGVNRIHHYLTQAQHTLHLPIAEAMLNYKEKRYLLFTVMMSLNVMSNFFLFIKEI